MRKKYLQTIRTAKIKVTLAEVPGRNVKRIPSKCIWFVRAREEDVLRKCEVRCKRCGDRYIGETVRKAYMIGH